MTQRRPITSVSEVVREDELPRFRLNFNLLEILFKPRRKLRPEREPPVPVLNPQQCRLVVQIIRGDNLPLRKSRCVSLMPKSSIFVQEMERKKECVSVS